MFHQIDLRIGNSVVFLWVSDILSVGAREHRDNVFVLPIGLKKEITGWGSLTGIPPSTTRKVAIPQFPSFCWH